MSREGWKGLEASEGNMVILTISLHPNKIIQSLRALPECSYSQQPNSGSQPTLIRTGAILRKRLGQLSSSI